MNSYRHGERLLRPYLSINADRELAALAEQLGGAPPIRIDPVRQSGNSRIYRVNYPTRILALKRYPPRSDDSRDRLGAEVAALRFLNAKANALVPELVTFDAGLNAALLEWLEGNPVVAAEHDIDGATAFLDRLHILGRDYDANDLPNAAEACLSGRDLESQVINRFQRLMEVAPDFDNLELLLRDTLNPAVEKWVAQAQNAYRQEKFSWTDNITREIQILSPSDFGFHNALRRGDGALIFLDFEYFGWDDPVKLVSDFLLHPGMKLTITMRQRFISWAFARFKADTTFAIRFRALYPLFGLRWCAILLNEFLPEKWAIRAHAGEQDMKEAQDRQLAKTVSFAQQLLNDDGIRDAFNS